MIGGSLSDYAFSVATDKDGNVALSGHTYGSLGGPNAGGLDLWVAKFDSQGLQQWIGQLGTSELEYVAQGIAIDDATGTVYVIGYTAGALDGNVAAGDYDAFLLIH